MAKASKETASESMVVEGYEGHFEEIGGYTVGFETYTADADLAPLFVGLPDDRCQCPHLGAAPADDRGRDAEHGGRLGLTTRQRGKAPHVRGFPVAGRKPDSVVGSHPSGTPVSERLERPTWGWASNP